MSDLTPKQAKFVEEYLVDLNATRAAIRAGYSPKTAEQQGSRLLRNAQVRAAVDGAQTERSTRTQIDADWIVERAVEVAERCLQHRAVLDRRGERVMVETPDGEEAPAYVFDAKGAVAALTLLSRHTGGFSERHELTGPNGGPIKTEMTDQLAALPKAQRDAVRAAVAAALDKAQPSAADRNLQMLREKP